MSLLCGLVAGTSRAEPSSEVPSKYDIGSLDKMTLEELLGLQIKEASTGKHEQSILWSPSAVSVYTRREILASGARSLADFLRRVPGLDVFEMDPAAPLVSIRSQIAVEFSNRVLLLVDGQEAIMELTGQPLWGVLFIALEDIDRLEVIRGPGSSLYGANAFSGVVNVITREHRSTGGEVSFRAGELGDRYLHGIVRVAHPLGKGSLSFSGSVGSESIQSASDPDYRHARDLLAHGVVRYKLGDWLDLSLSGSYVEFNGILPLFFKQAHLEDDINHSVMGLASFKLSDRFTLHTQLYHYRYTFDARPRMRLYSEKFWLADFPSLYMESNQVDGKVQLDTRILDSLMLIVGGNVRYTDISSAKIIPEEADEVRGGGFVHLEWRPLRVLQLVGGMRADFNSETEEAISPRGAVIIQPWAGHAFRLSYSLAFRKPSFMERSLRLVFDDVTPIIDMFLGEEGKLKRCLENSYANPDVGNEMIQSLEAGWRALLLDNRLQLSVDFFYNRYLDVITSHEYKVKGLSDIETLKKLDRFFYYENQIDLWAIGSEIEVRYRPTRNLQMWANVGMRHVALEDEEQKVLLAAGRNQNIEDVDPRLRLNFGGGYDPNEGPVLDLSFHYVSRYTSTHWDFRNLTSEVSLDQTLGNAMLAIGRVGYRFGVEKHKWKVEVGATGRVPIGATFREVAGFPADAAFLHPDDDTTTDITGQKLLRLIDFYIRGSF